MYTSLISHNANFAPISPNWRAKHLPIPCPAPVINTTWIGKRNCSQVRDSVIDSVTEKRQLSKY